MQFGKILKFTIPAIMFLAITAQWHTAYTSVNGPDPGYTGAPGENGDCTSCHLGTPTTSSSSIKLKTHQSASVLEYLPDSTYTITVDFGSTASKYGFQTTALINSNSRMAGTFNITNTSTTKATNATFSSNTRYYVEHTSGGTSSKSWSFEWKAPSTNVGNIVFYVAANAANGNSGTSGDAIHTNSFTFAPSSKLPVASISIVNNVVCAGDSLKFSGSGSNTPLSYKWTFAGGTPSTSTAQNPKVQYKTAGTYSARLSVSNAYGVSTEVTRSIIVRAVPDDTIAVGGAKTICDGDSVKLTAAAGTNYLWSTGETTAIIYAKKAGSYSVKVSNAFNCTIQSKPVNISVLDKPLVALSRSSGADNICQEDSIVFDAATGLSTYTFYDGNSITQSGASNTFTARNITFGSHNFYLIATDSNGCRSDTSAKYEINVINRLPAPTLICGTPTTESVTINWNDITGATGYEVSTDGGTNWTNVNALSFTQNGLDANETVFVMVRATDNTVCKTGNTSTINCKTLPCSELTYNLDYDSVVCQGNNAVINFGKFSSGTYAITLNGGAPTKEALFSLALTGDSTVIFNLYDSTKLNCPPIEAKLNFRYNLVPALAITPATSYCSGDEIILQASPGFPKYSFYKNGIKQPSGENGTLSGTTFKNKDKIYVIGETALGCTKQSEEISLNISTRTNPGFIYTGNKLVVTFKDTTAQASIRSWNFGDGNTSASDSVTHTYAADGQYTVWLVTTNVTGCKDSVSKTLDVSSVGVRELYFLREANVYPNPFKDALNVTIFAVREAKMQLNIIDMRGRTILTKPIQDKIGKNDITIPTGDIPAGAYLLRIQSGKDIINKKIVKGTEN